MSQDILQRFLFETAPARGVAVQLTESYQTVINQRDYPPVLQKLLGELMAAAVLISANLKFGGALVLQVHGSGNLKLLVVECETGLKLRATANWEGDIPDLPLAQLMQSGKFVITLDPKDGSQPYQGIVAMDADSIADIIEHYMLRSAQIDTRLWLGLDGQTVGGLLLQKLPEGHGDIEDWNRVQALASTVTAEELAGLPPQEVLHRLFHEEDRRLFDEEHPAFECTCSRERVGAMLKMVGKEEVEHVLAEQNQVEVRCDFCNKAFQFDSIDITRIFGGHGSDITPDTRH